MRVAAIGLFLCSWLWWSGLDVPPRVTLAYVLWGMGTVFLFLSYLGAGRRLPSARRVARSATWAFVLSVLAGGLALVSGPVIDRVAPFVSYATVPGTLFSALARWFGIEAVAANGAFVVQDLAAVPAHATSLHQLSLLPAAVVLVLIALTTACRIRRWLRTLGIAVLIMGAWLPLKFLLLTRIVEDLGWLGIHWHPVATTLGLLPAVWLAGLLSPMRSLIRLPRSCSRRGVLAFSLVALGILGLVFGLSAHPPGRPAAGRILIDGAHSDWEWTTVPFDRESYSRQSTYNYFCMVDFLSHHYARVDTNSREELTDELLARYDLLILKTPTDPYLESERDAVTRFVERGGGLLLISDHTNLFGMSTYLNPIGEPFGIEFVFDDTFELTTGRPSSYSPPLLAAHPAVVHIPGLVFETSCSLRPGLALRPVIVGRGLGAELVDYSHINFFGNIEPDPDERWGVFLQAASTTHGRGRVLAFTDSTVFSNFSVFFRGKPELLLGMIEFLNRSRGPWDFLFPGSALIGVLLLGVGTWWFLRRSPQRPGGGRPRSRAVRVPAVCLALIVGLFLGGLLASRVNARNLPLPVPQEPMWVLAFDREHSSFRLPTLLDQTVADSENCFDAFFVATQRIHLFPMVAEDLRQAMRSGNVVVLINPESSPAANELQELVDWVRSGGRLLVMESLSGPHLAANRFLEPVGLRISAAFPGDEETPTISGFAIYGGQPVRLNTNTPLETEVEDSPSRLISIAEYGEGRVVVVLGSESFSYQRMGPTFSKPNPEQRAIYGEVYALFEDVVLREGWPRQCRLRVAYDPDQ